MNKLFVLYLLVLACSPRSDINYGADSCDFCSMTIVDQQHSALIKNEKGKLYAFDSIECMIQYTHKTQIRTSEISVADYLNLGTFIDAETAVYIVSKQIPSPMGAYLSACSSKDKADEIIAEKTGEIYNWVSVNQKFGTQNTYN